MCHLLQMKAERLLTQAQAQISTLKLAGHLVAAAVCSNAVHDVETVGTAENTGVVFAVQPKASLLLSSNIFAEFIGDKMGFPFRPLPVTSVVSFSETSLHSELVILTISFLVLTSFY